MGRKKTYVGTSVMRVVSDEMLPDANKTGLLTALIENSDITENVMEQLVGSVGMRAERMYAYGASKYTHGLPSGTITSTAEGLEQVTTILSGIEGQPVLVEYSNLSPPNSLHLGWMALIQLHGYSPDTNKLDALSAEKGTDVFLHDMVVTVPPAQLQQFHPEVLAQWGKSPRGGVSPTRPGIGGFIGSIVGHTPVTTDPAATDDYLKVVFAWEEPQTFSPPEGGTYQRMEARTASFKVPITDALANSAAEYFHVKYVVNGAVKYWMYQVGSGTYPLLDAMVDAPPKVNGTFFPFIYFRYDKRSEISDTTTTAYKTSKKMSKYLGLDYDAIAEAVDENPDIGDIQQAMLIMAVPANTTNELERRYLFQFFDNLYYSKEHQHASPVFGNYGERASITIQDTRFKMQFREEGTYKRRVVGNIGKIGDHDSGVSSEPKVLYSLDEYGQSHPYTINTKYHYYRKQISAMLYDELLVVGMQMYYYVSGDYTTCGDEEDDILLIPIDRSITKEYSIKERELLYSRSMHYVFNSMQVVKLKWYQTGLFRVIMLIVTVIITIWTWGAASPLMAAFTAATGIAITTALAVLLFNLLVGLFIGMVFKLFVKIVGVKFAFLVAIVAAVAGVYSIAQNGGLTGAPWATQLLHVSSGLSNGVSAVLKDNIQDLLGEFAAFDLYKDEMSKELSTANKLLDTNHHMSPLIIFGESPDDFYNRTIHAGNIGAVGMDAIHNYVDIALTLPKFNDTIGEPQYG